jgi:hypothetical protein
MVFRCPKAKGGRPRKGQAIVSEIYCRQRCFLFVCCAALGAARPALEFRPLEVIEVVGNTRIRRLHVVRASDRPRASDAYENFVYKVVVFCIGVKCTVYGNNSIDGGMNRCRPCSVEGRNVAESESLDLRVFGGVGGPCILSAWRRQR